MKARSGTRRPAPCHSPTGIDGERGVGYVVASGLPRTDGGGREEPGRPQVPAFLSVCVAG